MSTMEVNAQANATRTKASPAQLSYLAEHMSNHPSLASGLSQTLQGRANLDLAWQNLATKLNSLGGAIKTATKWKQAWRDLRNNTKKKASHNYAEYRGYGPGSTGNGPPNTMELTQVEEQVLTVMGPVAVYGMEDIECTEPIQHTESPELPNNKRVPVSAEAPYVKGSSLVMPGQSSMFDDAKQEPPAPLPKRKRRRIMPRQENFDSKILLLEERKIEIKNERNAIDKEKNAILSRISGLHCILIE